MLLYRRDKKSTYRTDLGDMKVTWFIQSGVPYIMFLNDHTSGKPAYRWPDIPMPSCNTGHVAFGPDENDYPTLGKAIELLPIYEKTLWEAVRTEHRAEIIAGQTFGCTVGRTFTDKEHSAWLHALNK